jgi:hypothetical protein
MKKVINIGILAMLATLLSGCWAPKCVMTTANITQPVLVGKVETIKGKPLANNSLDSISKFSATIKNSIFIYSTAYYYGHRIENQGSSLLDKQFLPLTDNNSEGKIVADQIRFNSGGGYWLFALYSVSQGWIEGKKYRLNSNK